MRRALLFIVLSTFGCSHWARVPSLPPPVADATQKPVNRLRLTLKDGRRIVLHQPMVRGDSVFGMVALAGNEFEGPGRRRTAFPLHSIWGVESRQFNPARTAVALGYVAAMILFMTSLPSSPY